MRLRDTRNGINRSAIPKYGVVMFIKKTCIMILLVFVLCISEAKAYWFVPGQGGPVWIEDGTPRPDRRPIR